MTEHPSLVTARSLVGALVALQVSAVAYCPGSRNAPFAYALAQAESEGLIRVATFSDERGAGFWAVGYMKATGAPVAVITTSGTAVAELHPAVEESAHQELPLLVLTADRPHHMRGVGASQTTWQEGIFGHSTVASAAIPAGATSPAETSAVLTRLTQLALRTGGPVHLNVAFADPLVPKTNQPIPEVQVPKFIYGQVDYPTWEDLCDPNLTTVVVAGDQSDPQVLASAAARKVPILAEPTSGASRYESWVPHAPLLLSHFPDASRIEQVVVTGAPTLTRPVTALVANSKVRKVVCSPKRIHPDVSGTAHLVSAGMRYTPPEGITDAAWLRAWKGAASEVSHVIAKESDGSLNLLSVSAILWGDTQPVDLWLAASNAVRGFDLAADSSRVGEVYANRGLAGIDGSIASALGVAQGRARPLRAVVGDMAFAADLSSLAQRPGGTADMQVFVLNDGGGGIFASLEHGGAPTEVYERYFAVPPRLDVVEAAQSAGWAGTRVETTDQLIRALKLPVKGLRVVEVIIPRPDELLRVVGKAVRAVLRETTGPS